MRIAQVAPLYESVPPRRYGGTERVVSYVTEELVRVGHEVTLFATGDSVTRARLVSTTRRALRTDDGCGDWLAPHYVMLEEVYRQAGAFDVIHFHVDYLHFPHSRRHRRPQVSTLHGPLYQAGLAVVFGEFPEMPVVSISDAQRRPLPWLAWEGTVHHGLPEDLHRLRAAPGEYLCFLGRVSPEKRLDRAIEIARRVGLPLKVAAKIDAADRVYYEERIRPMLAWPGVEFLGEVNEREKDDLLGGALALLFPIDWAEPFGLVMIEALACGTPVVAWPNGSVPEVLQEGVTGFLVRDVAEAAQAVERIGSLDRRACRRAFEERFSVGRMVEDYLAVYARLLGSGVRSGLVA